MISCKLLHTFLTFCIHTIVQNDIEWNVYQRKKEQHRNKKDKQKQRKTANMRNAHNTEQSKLLYHTYAMCMKSEFKDVNLLGIHHVTCIQYIQIIWKAVSLYRTENSLCFLYKCKRIWKTLLCANGMEQQRGRTKKTKSKNEANCEWVRNLTEILLLLLLTFQRHEVETNLNSACRHTLYTNGAIVRFAICT